MTVVGVIKDIKHEGLDARAMPHVYTSLYQLQSKAMSLVARTSLPASAIEQQIRREVQAIDPNLPVFNVRPLDEVIGVNLAPRRFSAELVGAFAALALLLASVGIYGLLAYMVGQRRSEIGVRVALGAQRSDIRRLVLRRGALLTGSGVSIGLLLSAVAAPAIAALLYGVRPIDPVVFLAAPASSRSRCTAGQLYSGTQSREGRSDIGITSGVNFAGPVARPVGSNYFNSPSRTRSASVQRAL
jgi:putative ABC transport system permease protein